MHLSVIVLEFIIFLNSKVAIFRLKSDFYLGIILWYQKVCNYHRDEVNNDVNQNNAAGN